MFYSQDKQDEYLEKNVFKGYKNGVFMDIGAHDGIGINNTLFFEREHQWTGVNVEAIKDVYDKLCKNRPNCINLNYAACNNDGVADFIHNTGYTEMISGLYKDYDNRHNKRLQDEISQYGGNTQLIKVNTKKIETICNEHNIKNINYLSIDVEGAEFDVIKSINFEKVFIDVIGFENNYNDSSVPIVEYLINKGYIVIHSSLDIFMINVKSQFYTKLYKKKYFFFN
jgi:FkbM family methyltransferase